MEDKKMYRCSVFEDSLRNKPCAKWLLTEEQKRLLDACIKLNIVYDEIVFVIEAEEEPFNLV